MCLWFLVSLARDARVHLGIVHGSSDHVGGKLKESGRGKLKESGRGKLKRVFGKHMPPSVSLPFLLVSLWLDHRVHLIATQNF